MSFSKALLNIFKERDTFQAEKSLYVYCKEYSIYFGTNQAGKAVGVFYVGRSLKANSYYFQSEEKRKAYTDSFISDCEVKKLRKKRAGVARKLEIGDVLYSSWGFEQTNFNFYLVLDLVGKESVKIVEIAGIKKEDNILMTGIVIPNIEVIKGEPMVKRVKDGDQVRIESFMSASPARYKIIAGCRIFLGYHFSSYG